MMPFFLTSLSLQTIAPEQALATYQTISSTPSPIITPTIELPHIETISEIGSMALDQYIEPVPSAPLTSVPKEQTNTPDVWLKRPYYHELKDPGILTYWNASLNMRYLDYQNNNPDYSWEDAVTYVNIGLDAPFYDSVIENVQCDRTTILVNKYHNLPNDYEPIQLQTIRKSNSTRHLKLRQDACTAFELMCDAAKEDNVDLIAVSAYRSYSYQCEVYDRKKTKQQSLEEYQSIRDRTIARPGYSEHQTGLAVDVGTTDDYRLVKSFESTDAGIWLAKNSYLYGFILRYPKGKEYITGYKYEPWHFRYLGTELAQELYDSNLTYDEFCARGLIEVPSTPSE
jgi:D-alanyl-D-alanine carboxypeptidase